MIESKTLGSAAGIQYQGVIDKTETNSLPSLSNGVITGRFKRGRMDKPFKVTTSNYQALLGRDPMNPSYLAVEDAFKRGISEVSILRTGSSSASAGGDTVENNSNLIFSVESYNNPTNSYPLYIYFDAPQGDWEITESGVVVADSTGFTAEWVDLVFDGSGGADIYFNISTPDIKQFESNVTASYVGIYYNGDYTAERESPLGEIIIKQFSSKIPEFSTQLFSTLLQVPQTIPPELVDINRLFIDAYLFNQDISMWDVSNVVNMNRMLESAKTFNQDLSEWCVPNITSLPESFDLNTPQWTLPKPVWGTCPRGENVA